jgi:hypothetical protein
VNKSLIRPQQNPELAINLIKMKTFFIIVLLSCCVWDVKAQTQAKMGTLEKDSVAISQALEKIYFQGIYEGDVVLLGQIYHPGTLLFGDVQDQPYAKTLGQYLDGVAHRQSPKDSGKPFKGTILNIRVVNSIAVAELTVKMYDFNYHEFLSFHRIDGKWLIVNKMISDVNP